VVQVEKTSFAKGRDSLPYQPFAVYLSPLAFDCLGLAVPQNSPKLFQALPHFD
jgi:hypothetical protein